jgi:photosynthetic reaction center H subunit
MGTGAITGYIDVAQIVLYMFWVFFAGLIFYLQRESKREGYPMSSDRPGRPTVEGLLPMPRPKTYLRAHGGPVTVPRPDEESRRTLPAVPIAGFPGAPLEPTGNPMLDNIGPGGYAFRADEPELALDDHIKIVPLKTHTHFSIFKDPDPRGLTVYGADGEAGGVVTDLWLDRSDLLFRYLEVEVKTAAGTRSVLLPINFCRVGRDAVRVHAIMGHQFASVPGTKTLGQVTLLEEEKITAYYAAGLLYADPRRQEPLL